eukprot:SM000011S19113  [mRNA]  locus=s11:965777:969204:- [translate_table: standard]
MKVPEGVRQDEEREEEEEREGGAGDEEEEDEEEVDEEEEDEEEDDDEGEGAEVVMAAAAPLVDGDHLALGYDFEADEDRDSAVSEHDTSAAQARQGKDIQGIPWESLHFTRDKYRENRLQQYKNYENLDHSHDQLERECKQVQIGGKFYDFRYNTRSVKSTIVHFQLRNLVWATSKHDVYVMHQHVINHWSPVSRKSKEVLNLGGTVTPAPNADRSLCQQRLGKVQISTMCARRNLLVAGGFHGEMVCKRLESPGVSYCSKITHDENAITNAIEIFDSVSSGMRVMSSNNDSMVRVFDGETFCTLHRHKFPWPVNHTSVSPDGKLVLVVGDNPEGHLADSQTGKTVATLEGHLDHSFASGWHPDGHIFATGNQDMTCRLWDLRFPSAAFASLKGRIGAIRSIRFTTDGRFMAMAEPADFVHVFDIKQGFARSQEIDLFGEVAGISFSPDSEALYVGVADRTYGSLLEFNRRHNYTFLDSFI